MLVAYGAQLSSHVAVLAGFEVCFQCRLKKMEEEVPASFFSHKYEPFIREQKIFLQLTSELPLMPRCLELCLIVSFSRKGFW